VGAAGRRLSRRGPPAAARCPTLPLKEARAARASRVKRAGDLYADPEPGSSRLTGQAGVLMVLGHFGGESKGSEVPMRDKEQQMSKAQLKKFKDMLEAKRQEIIKRAQQTLDEDMTLDANDLPDEMDLASSEYLQSFTFRLRGREKVFLDKIQKALEKIDNGTFGTCDDCGEKISIKRLEARPETTLCIRCKEDQERVEKDFT
jgi:DnaK suppressor protein